MKEAPVRTVADAYNRIGDCYFMKPAYWVAIENYDKAINYNLSSPDYAYFQKGFSFGLVDRPERKVETLTQLIEKYPNSVYLDDAMFEIGKSYVTLNKSDQAIASFRSLITNYPTSAYVSKALLQLGLVYYNMNQSSQALTYYKQVVSEYPASPEARNALTGIKNIYVEMNQVDTYIAYANSLGDFSNVSLSEQDSMTYKAAENIYMSSNFEKAETSFTNYLNRFPNGNFKLNATFYLSDCILRGGHPDKAVEGFEMVASSPRNMFTEQALMATSAIYFNQGKYAESLTRYQQLENEAEIPSNILDAKIGIMRCYFRMGQYKDVVPAARKVLADNTIPEETARESRFILAKSLQEEKNLNDALTEYRKVAKETSSLEGAESKYHVIEILFQQSKIKEAEDEVFDFVARSTPHQYWMAKSLMVVSDIYVAQGDIFQATQTLQSIIDNYGVKDDGIIDEANRKKAALEDKSNASGKKESVEVDEVEIK